jgi:hypothetical protein
MNGEFIYVESWSELPLGEQVGSEAVVVRTPIRKQLISFHSSGEELLVEQGCRDALFDLEGRECEIYVTNDLPAEFISQANL